MTHPIPEAALSQHIAILGKTGSGNFNNIAGKLSSMDVLRRTGTGRVALSDWAREVLL